jgi:glycosyltransferase involved in cell wall biosynthesis
MSQRLNISVVVIARNEEHGLGACLSSLADLDYPRESLEILVIDNASTDGTRAIAQGFAKQFPHFRVIDNPIRGIAPTRNVGLKAARHEFVAFTDADCTAERSWLSALELAFREEREHDVLLTGIGGSNLAPLETTLFRRAVAVAVTTYWGNHGSIQGKLRSGRAQVDHLPTLNVLYDKKRLLELNGFDEGMGNISEDVDMSHRLRWKGFKLMHEPKAIIRHAWREDPLSWAQNMEVYGKGRTWLMRKDGRYIKPLHLAPLILLYFTLTAPFIPSAIWVPVAYIIGTALASTWAGLKNRKPHYIPLVFLIYALTHYAYGIGQLHGFFSARGSDIRD